MPADFAKARGEAVRLLLASRLYSPKTDVFRLNHSREIVFESFSGFCRNSLATVAELESLGGIHDGCTVIRRIAGKTVYLVLYNDRVKPRERIRFTLAHELGHIMLDHARDASLEESEADCFAAELLLPRILVWALQKDSRGKITTREVSELFAVSMSVSENQMNALYRDHDFSDDEKRLLKKQIGFLPEYGSPVIDC